jgi:CRP-like cAMP-binding protein
MNLANHPELSTIQALAGKRPPRHIRAGEVIFRSDDSGDTLYGVEIIEAGSGFGAGALADQDHRRFGTATALSETELLEMDREQFLFAMQELPMFGLEMLHDLEIRLQKLKQAGSNPA